MGYDSVDELPPEELACCAICNDGEWIEGVSLLHCDIICRIPLCFATAAISVFTLPALEVLWVENAACWSSCSPPHSWGRLVLWDMQIQAGELRRDLFACIPYRDVFCVVELEGPWSEPLISNGRISTAHCGFPRVGVEGWNVRASFLPWRRWTRLYRLLPYPGGAMA